MRLISLELHGFKSFPDKTVLKFAPGVTTVVGPNGSGKSNISDAVRWVLGELSSKSIRGSKMEDVVFGGTDKRKPMQFAEVSLTLDNREEDGFSRLQSEYDEVTVTRRYNRNGTSEYKINGQPVRLKDINTLFMNTGIGRDGYSMVSQGKAAEIISQKSDERRNVFEEAAGISKYRYQKNDAEKKLAETVLNCERLADILLEKKTQLDRLEKDAERARRFLDVYEKKKEADVSISVYEISKIRKKIDEKSEKFEALTRALALSENEISDDTAEYERIDISRNKAKESASLLTSQIEDITTTRHSEDISATEMRKDLEHLELRLSDTKEQITAYTKALENAVSEAERAADMLSIVTDKKNAADQKQKKIQEEIASLRDKIEETDINIENILSKIDTSNAIINELGMRLAGLKGTSTSSEAQRISLTKELEETRKTTVSCEEGMATTKRRMDDYSAKADVINKKLAEFEMKATDVRKQADDTNNKIISYASDIRDIRTRIDSLRRMEELFEGYPTSVSSLMSASRAGKISGIIGPLSHIFTVNSQYSLAIETALGSNIQNIVCESDKSAKEAVAWLKQNNSGRSTFYPLNTMQVTPLSINANELKNRKGYIGIASDLVQYEPKFEKVIKNLLGRTLVFDNLDNANETSKAYSYRIRIVTKDGQLINAGGSITGGAAKRESGVLNRTATIEKLTAELMKIQAEKNAAEEKYTVLSDELVSLEKSVADSSAQLKLIDRLYQNDLTHYTAFETQLKTIHDSIAKLEEQINDVDIHDKSIEDEKKAILFEQENTKKLIENLFEQKNAKTKERLSLRAALEAKIADDTNSKVEVASFNKDVESAQLELENRVSSKNECEDELAKANLSIENDKKKISDLKNSIMNASNLSKQLEEKIHRMTSERDEAERLGNELDARLSVLNKTISEKRSAQQSIATEHSKLETQLETSNLELDRTVAYLTNEYEITFTEAVALNYPPVTDDNHAEITKTLTELKNKLRNIGSVDPNSIEEYRLAKETYEEMNTQFEDLSKSREEFANTVELLEREMRTKFVEVMGEINIAFQNVFRELFGGGNAELVLTDPDDVLHCGIDINVAPPGKIIKNLSLLSGGEQAFISIALFFAILKVNPSPFCIFDEIEAALDEVNVAMFANYIKKYSDKTQFITITHRRGTMEVADTLYGVTMAERGISRVLSLNVNEVESKLGVKL